MIGINEYNFILNIWIVIAVFLFPVLLIVTVPYGRHTKRTWGLKIGNNLGWIIMESPALIVFIIFFLSGTAEKSFILWMIFCLWLIHYLQRTFLYPFQIKTKGKEMPVLIMILALLFNIVNGFFIGYYFGYLTPAYDSSWAGDPRFIGGILLFVVGMSINWYSDNKLINLRKSDENRYFIPYGGLFKFISCPNFFGEIIEWLGFVILTWSWPALAFFVWTLVNLIPRALDHHKWYKKEFSDYPSKRKAIIPFIL